MTPDHSAISDAALRTATERVIVVRLHRIEFRITDFAFDGTWGVLLSMGHFCLPATEARMY
jgi:hypothetical protein